MLSIADVQQVVRTAIGGQTISESVEGLERFPINLRYPQEWRNSPERLRDLPVVTPSGAHIPLGALAEISVVDGPGMIRSENARRTGFVFIDIAGRDLGSYVAEARTLVAEKVALPPGISTEIRSPARRFSAARAMGESKLMKFSRGSNSSAPTSADFLSFRSLSAGTNR